MTIRASLPCALSRIAISIAVIAAIGLVWTRLQEHRWPDSYFYVSFAVAFALLAAGSCLIIIPRSITLTDDSLSIDWPFRRKVTVPLDELEAYMQARLFMIQLERHPTQLIFEGAFARGEWRTFTRELESRFPDRKASFYAGTLLFGRRKP